MPPGQLPPGAVRLFSILNASGETDVAGEQGIIVAWDDSYINALIGVLGLGTQLPSPIRVWHGAPTHNSFRVCFDVAATNASLITSAGLIVSVHSDLSSPVFVASPILPGPTPGLSGNYYPASFTATGLAADTLYYFAPIVNGNVFTTYKGTTRTAPTPGTAKSFKFATASCINSAYPLSNVWSAIANEGAAFMVFTGDIAYPDVGVDDIRVQRGTNTRTFRGMADVQAMLLTVPWIYMFDDHDSAGDDNHWDKLYSSLATNDQIVTNTRTVYKETTPHFPLWDTDKVLGQSWTWGRCRFLMPDLRSQRRYEVGTPTIMGNGTNPPGSFDQLAYVLAAIQQAEMDGMKMLFFISSSTWYPAIFDSWQTNFTLEQGIIADAIRDVDVQVILVHGDSHQCGIDDGTNSDRSTTLTAKYPLVMSSAVWQGGVFDKVLPMSWNGANGDVTGPTPQMNPPGTGNANAYATIEITDNGGDDIHYEIVFKGAPITAGVATVIGEQASWRDDDAVVEAGFSSSSTLNIIDGQAGQIQVEKTWVGPPGGASVVFTFASGPSGVLSFLPNCNNATIPYPYTTGLSDTVTLSLPNGCVLGAIVAKNIAYFTPNAATLAYLAAMSTPPTTDQIYAIDQLIVGLIADGVWAKILNMWWLGAPTQQASLLDAKNPGSNTLTVVGTMQYAPLQGWRGVNNVGVNTIAHLESGVAIPGANQNSISMFVWSISAATAWGEMGGDYYYVNQNGAATGDDFRTRSSSTTTDSVANALDVSGMFGWSRTGSANYTTYENGTAISTITRTSAAPNSTTMWVCGFQNTLQPTLNQSGGRTNALSVIASGLTGTEVGNLYTRWQTFLQAIGTIS